MSGWRTITKVPYRLLNRVMVRRRFGALARENGLVYFGLLRSDDEHDAVRGFTAHAGQVDDHVIHGTVHGRDVTLLQRTVTHTSTPKHPRAVHDHTWLIAAVRHEVKHAPHVLLLSHEHPRLHDEATAIHHDRSQHVAIEYRIDAQFLAYARPVDATEFREVCNEDLTTRLLSKPGYDYEFDSQWVYVYSHIESPTAEELTSLLGAALAVANAYDDPELDNSL